MEVDGQQRIYMEASQIDSVCQPQSIPIHSVGVPPASVTTKKTWTPEVDLKPYKGQVFISFDEAFAFYKEYAQKSGFEIRKTTTEKCRIGDGYSRRYIVCNREGNKRKFASDSAKSGKKQQRNRPSHRIGCKACIRLKVNVAKLWEITFFEEKHTHEFVEPEDLLFLKSNRRLTYRQKQLISDVSNINMGPVKAYKVLKQTQGGFGKVGATVVDCKNFKRDLNSIIGDGDVDLVIEKLDRKREYLHDFSFEVCEDTEGNLAGLFWADEEAKRNYQVFGDVVGFDATFRTNKYMMVLVPFTGIDNHKKCVTFVVGLLSNESKESYTWLLNCFKNTFGREPTILMTDQDPSVKEALPAVFSPSCRHRLCMWHISQKFTKNLGSQMSKTGVLKRLHDLIWKESIKPAEFEAEWQSIMDEYELNSNVWFTDIFAIRDKWIPAYFKDSYLSGLMRTTSRSEGENYFYGLITSTDLHLIEFLSHFETAMESQRYVQRKNNHDSRYTTPENKSATIIEEEASKIFTRTIFFEIQTEILASIHTCFAFKVEEMDGISKYWIKDTDKDVKHYGDFEVLFVKSGLTMNCSCLKFELSGIVCRHCFYILRMTGVEHFPSKYVSKRWTKDVVPRSSSKDNTAQSRDEDGNNDIQSMIRDIQNCVDHCVDRLATNLEKLNVYRETHKQLVKDVDEDTKNEQPMTNKMFIESVIGVERRTEIKVGAPKNIRNKGSKKRLLGEKEKAIMDAKKGSRKCGGCGEYVDHNARTCAKKRNSTSA